jgi:23S rRNA (pseudouridine1915-N3)-methyltransferase
LLEIDIVCVGRMKEKYYSEAAAEYIKRLGAYCRVRVTELQEARRDGDSPAATEAALRREAEAVRGAVPKGAAVAAMCVEGKELSSEELSAELAGMASRGISRICFLIGGSDGLAEELKKDAKLRISMSRMTFPHHLARVMLLEQLYRAFSIAAGGRYHK